MYKNKKICVADLDGTLLPNRGKLSDKTINTLGELKEKGILRVLATGRSLYSLRQALDEDAPFDYVIFSTGAGILNWQNQELIHSQNLDNKQILEAHKILEEHEIDYMLHNSVPDTHLMHYRAKVGVKDFWDRVELYQRYACEFDPKLVQNIEFATQYLAIVEPENHELLFEGLKQRLLPLKTIRTTSPLDFKSFWIEIFAPKVSKGHAIIHLAESLGHGVDDCMVIGNDYNDLDMLEVCPNSYVVANSPDDLKERFTEVSSCKDDGFSEAVQTWLES
ncbi:MAG: HAD-IIB family hydrolase [Candidatus Cloacimonetes bacterium]|jgi:Cof subfamily protein (haloacid dehalogenase superfamily)|nr:HAD-IIB family hydrolase [Candidatus Cloacimonadota bacterium]